MAEIVRMPRMSDTMAEGVIVAWHKKVGDKIKPGDLIAEVETDKATMELESYNTGTILHIGVEEGKAAVVEGLLFIVGKEGEDIKGLLNENTKIPAPVVLAVENVIVPTAKTEIITLPAGAKEIRMPLLSDTMTEGKILAWNKKIGDLVKSDDVIAEVETDKATMEVVGYEAGTLLYIGVEAGKAAKINEIIAIVGKPGTDVAAYVASQKAISNTPSITENKASKPEPTAIAPVIAAPVVIEQPVNTNSNSRILASPLAKKLAADKGVDLKAVQGSGDGGRVIKKDIDNYVPTAASNSGTVAANNNIAQTIAVVNGVESHTDIPLTQMRKTVARRLSESKFSAPHFYLTMEINMDEAIKARAVMNEVSTSKISYNDMVIKACATALKLHPDVNSSWMGDFIRLNHHVNIGMAVALPEGLIVPVIKFADQKSISEISAEAKSLAGKAKDKKLQPVEFTGNTFTISNLGMMGIEEFTAIINPPDSCILAVGGINEVVVKTADGFGVSNRMKLTLSCDHRSVDGAVGSAFLVTLKKFLENPITMLV